MCPVVRDRWSQKDDAGAALARVWFCLTVILSGWFAAPAGAVQAETETPSIVAAAAIAIEAESGRVLYAKEPDTPRAPASLTKLATALTAVELAPRDTVLTVLAQDLMGESSMGLCPGEQITLEAALYGLLLASGNDAAMTIARNLSGLPGDTPEAAVNRFVKQMNLLAQRLGLERTTFRNPHGLDQEGHVTTARDLALLTRAVLQRPELRRILQTPSYDDGVHAVQTTNRLLGRYPGLIGGKTGITEVAGYSLIEAAERDGTTVIVVVLGSTRDAWYADAVQLLDYAFAQLAPAPVAGLAGSAAEASERDILASRPIGDAAMTVGGPSPDPRGSYSVARIERAVVLASFGSDDRCCGRCTRQWVSGDHGRGHGTSSHRSARHARSWTATWEAPWPAQCPTSESEYRSAPLGCFTGTRRRDARRKRTDRSVRSSSTRGTTGGACSSSGGYRCGRA